MILNKLGDEYKLYSHDSCIATTYESPYKKLSLKNCEAIANGYDLDELAYGCDLYEKMNFVGQMSAFKLGFQKAIEILGDKKFGEFLDKEKELGISDIKTIERIQWYYKTYFDKSQQNEWEVTFNPDEKDSNGCLILKRK